MARPALSEFLALAAEGTYARAPVSTEIMADFITPIEVMRKMKKKKKMKIGMNQLKKKKIKLIMK